jgi:hypothetical protein
MSQDSLWAAIRRGHEDLDFRCEVTADLDAAARKHGLVLEPDEKESLRKFMMSPPPPQPGTGPMMPDWEFMQKLGRERMLAQHTRNNSLADFTLETLKDTLSNAKNAYRIITLMNRVMFFTGIGLFVFAAFYGAFSNEKTFSLFLGGLGVANFAALFFLGPIEKTQIALSNLVQVEIAFMHYFEQMLIWEFYAQVPKGNPPAPDPAAIERASAALRQVSAETMESLQTYVENPIVKSMAKKKKAASEAHGSDEAAREQRRVT